MILKYMTEKKTKSFNESLKKRIKSLTEEHLVMRKKIDELNLELESSKEKYDEELESWKEKYDEMSKKIGLPEEIERLQQEKHRGCEEIMKLKKQYGKLDKKLRDITEEYEEKEDAIEARTKAELLDKITQNTTIAVGNYRYMQPQSDSHNEIY